MTTDILPNDILLEIFNHCREDILCSWWWEPLAHVCQRWRQIIFDSPQSLHLMVSCNGKTPTRTSLDIWPPFPIAITYFPRGVYIHCEDNIIAALEHRGRVSQITFHRLRGHESKIIFDVLREPFPALTYLHISCTSNRPMPPPFFPEQFLGGCAPHLRSFSLGGVRFPKFPEAVLSASHLVTLRLWDIPTYDGSISPEAMATSLVAWPNLKDLYIQFQHPHSRHQISLPPPTRAVLPALTYIHLSGASDYLDDLVSRIDTPLLERLEIYFLADHILDIPELQKFIDRTERLKPLNRAEIKFPFLGIAIALGLGSSTHLQLDIRCQYPGAGILMMAHVCSGLSPLISHVEQLDLSKNTFSEGDWGIDVEPSLFSLFKLFTGVRSLSVSGELLPLIAPALRRLAGERATEVFPHLHSISFTGPPPSESIRKDIDALFSVRQYFNCPIIVYWSNEI